MEIHQEKIEEFVRKEFAHHSGINLDELNSDTRVIDCRMSEMAQLSFMASLSREYRLDEDTEERFETVVIGGGTISSISAFICECLS
tara:strand:+ start:658 stop:918 length:261 start_codon:yes stop_codon:yes gene_type:complete